MKVKVLEAFVLNQKGDIARPGKTVEIENKRLVASLESRGKIELPKAAKAAK